MEVTMTSVVATAPAAAQAGTAARFRPTRVDFKNFKPQHFLWQVDGSVATITLNRPERKNPLTLESYSELRDTFRDLVYADNIKTVVITGAGGNFGSGGDVHEIIGPLVEMQLKDDMAVLLAFTRMTGQLVKEMRACPQPIVSAIDGICAGAGDHDVGDALGVLQVAEQVAQLAIGLDRQRIFPLRPVQGDGRHLA